MSWIVASSNPNLVILPGPFFTLQELEVRPIVQVNSVIPIGDLTTAQANPLTEDFIKAIESGRPVDSGGSGSIRPTTGLVYPRRI